MIDQSVILLAGSFLVVITLHEFAHALMADYLGDPTARLSGRLSLNPVAHLDLVGSVIFPAILILSRSPFVFGWAKPVPFDPYNLQNPRRDAALISLSGPVANFVTAILMAVVLRLVPGVLMVNSLFGSFFVQVLALSVILGLFNLIPVNPLDGGKILVGFLPREQANEVEQFLNRYGMFILIFIIITPVLNLTLFPIASAIIGLLVPGGGG
jgi:Zn-dependent protease